MLTQQAPKVREIFGLHFLIEQKDIERLSSTSSEDGGHVLYLFTCEGLLPGERRIALDDQDLKIGVYHNGTMFNTIDVDAMEMMIITSLVLSYPFPVDQSQLQMLHTMYEMQRLVDGCDTQDTGDEHPTASIHQFVDACNEKLLVLGIALSPIASAYTLRTVSQ